MPASELCLLFWLPVEKSGTCLLLKCQLWMWWQIIEILSIQSRELDIKYIAQIHAILRTMQNISFLAMHCFQTIIERFVVLYYFSVHSPVIWDARVIMWRHCNVVRCLNHADCLLFWSLAKKPGAHFTKALWARYPPLWDVRTTLTLKKQQWSNQATIWHMSRQLHYQDIILPWLIH